VISVIIATIGKAKRSDEHALYAEYVKRLPWKVKLLELELKKNLAPAARKEEEARLLLEACKGADRIIALDERGKSLSSPEFASQLKHWGDQGNSHFAFLIGGADGHGKAALGKAHLTLSLGKMTWPHLMVRAMLAEQLYRAHTILTGHPYHRE
jgi:23S rRNA (pseudouridine1915-N3)-methyltransferase